MSRDTTHRPAEVNDLASCVSIDNCRASSEDAGKEDDAMKGTLTFAAALTAGCLVSLAPAPARCAVQTVEHTIRAGDNLHLIAGYYYGDPRQWKKVWSTNRKALARPSLLVPGKILLVEGSSGEGWQGPYEDFRSRVRGK
jgi:hypothetical protein